MDAKQKNAKKCCNAPRYRGPRRPVYRMEQEPLPAAQMPKNCCGTNCCKKKDRKPEKKKSWDERVSNFFGVVAAPRRLEELGKA